MERENYRGEGGLGGRSSSMAVIKPASTYVRLGQSSKQPKVTRHTPKDLRRGGTIPHGSRMVLVNQF